MMPSTPDVREVDGDLARRRTAIIVRIVVAAFLACALVLYLTTRRVAPRPPAVSPTPAGKAALHFVPAPTAWTLDSDRL